MECLCHDLGNLVFVIGRLYANFEGSFFHKSPKERLTFHAGTFVGNAIIESNLQIVELVKVHLINWF